MRLDEIAKDDKELDEIVGALGAVARGAAAGAKAVGQGVKTAVTNPKAAAKNVANVAGQTLGHAMNAVNKLDQLSTGSMARTGQGMAKGANAQYGDPDFGNDENIAAAQQDPAKKAQLKRDMQQALRDKEEQIRAIRQKMRDLS